jgi:hypothetical protein
LRSKLSDAIEKNKAHLFRAEQHSDG